MLLSQLHSLKYAKIAQDCGAEILYKAKENFKRYIKWSWSFRIMKNG